MKIHKELFVGGEFVKSHDGRTFQDVNPANEELICDVALASIVDVNEAVDSSEAAQREWAALDPSRRGQIVMAMADAIEANGDELANIDCLDGGRPLPDCQEDIHAAAKMFRYFGGLADKAFGQTIPVQNDKLCYTKREPYGVIAAITAWNYPLFNASAKVAPIIAMGNSCILKPAEETPLTALRLAEILQDIDGVPPGLISVVTGPGEETGEALTRHERIRKVSFTGSTDTGRQILIATAQSNLKGAVLELGGKGPFLIFDDADLEMALNAITFSVFYNQGQTCTAGTRLIVPKMIIDQVINGLRDRISRIEVGDPRDESTVVGPLISKTQFDKVCGYISDARSDGYTPIIGQGKVEGFASGFYVEPTVFLDLPQGYKLCTDEVFGPILVVNTFETDDEAIRIANSSNYGLAASIWTASSKRLVNAVDRIDSGIVWCNTTFAEHPGAPAGGFNQSGFGREYGTSAIDEYTRLKTIWIDKSGEFFSWP
ncbi:aldehyde dehydrogenase family protein [Rhodovulum sulfidophilum]|uniref:aldehyde dehydrogenase family protein n=1 Tax=Rhodovulum sulfidophilum TaxID=35806 RepID=UPI0013895EA0|nr:aldehyde dehydrogenase family protein [Rhodovulum sulfidophilum]NDK36491.1 aldehyde dehydrogenase [Rhodovulum sulfidophilum]